MNAARYRLIHEEDLAHMPPAEVEKYRAERRRFDDEVQRHRAHIREHGWLDVGTKGREVRYYVLPRGRR